MKRQDVAGENTLHTDGTGGAGTNVNITGINGTAPSTGLGASDAGTLRVAISSDSPSAGNPAAGATGAAVPSQADYQGVNVGGTLRGATAVNPSGSIFAQQQDLASVAGTTTATGNGTTNAGTQRVTLSSDSTGQVALAAGSAVIGHVITDTGSTTVVTGNVTVVQGTATNLKAQAENYQGGTAVGAANPLQVSLANTGANGTAVKVDGTGGSFPVSGTVGVTQSTTPWIVAGGGTAGAAATGVVTVQGIASMTKLLVTPDANSAVNVAQLAGTATSVNSGTKDAGTLRVVIATDQPQLTNKLLVTPDANSSVNVNQIGGNAVNTGTGASGTGTQRVAVASDSSIILAAGTALIGKAAASSETSTIYSGTTALTPKFAKISASSSGDNTIVAAGTNKLRVLAWNLMANGTVNVKWQSGAGGTDLTGLYYLIANTGISVPYSPVGYFETTAATLLNLNLSTGVAVGGNIVYIDVA